METIPLLDNYTAPSSLHQVPSAKLHSAVGKGSESGGHSHSLHHRHHHHTHFTQHQHHSYNKALKTTFKQHNHTCNSESDAKSSHEISSDQLTLRPPAIFSDLNPIPKSSSSSLQGTQKIPLVNQQQLLRAHPQPTNSSSLMNGNQHGPTDKVAATTKSSDLPNTSVESLVRNN